MPLPCTLGRYATAFVLAAAVLAAAHLPAAARTETTRTVTLLTGDRIVVYGAGQDRWKAKPGAGRENITFSGTRVAGRLRVVPSDAAAPLRAGHLDERLFDVTSLLAYGYDDKRGDLPLIVTYADGANGRAAWSAPGARVVRPLPGKGTFAVRAERRHPGLFWRGLAAGHGALANGDVRKVWLDGIRQPELETSLSQIGARAAWQAGYTGSGVTVAVLDTGVDADHPDLAGRVGATRNFTDGFEDDNDRHGHGTHVASIVGGSRGVAPDTTLVSGKVCAVSGCAESWILAGMQWAAADQRAKVVNLSVGAPDTPGTDPLEEATDDLSARYGTLFVVSAGNRGPAPSVGSPASAAAALAVGAVDRKDRLAGFSSRGPGLITTTVKPELTAPGVGIVAARGSEGRLGVPGDLHTAVSGTSVAAAHVTGAAALLAQRHPDWPGERLKAALMASAHPVPGTDVFGQGAGRLNVVRAMTQTVTTGPAGVTFDRQASHEARTVAYHNHGAAPVTIDLQIRATGPDGKPAPTAMFTLGAVTLTVPPGGTARTTLTARTGPDVPDGDYSGYLMAVAGELVVHTPLSAPSWK